MIQLFKSSQKQQLALNLEICLQICLPMATKYFRMVFFQYFLFSEKNEKLEYSNSIIS